MLAIKSFITLFLLVLYGCYHIIMFLFRSYTVYVIS